MPDKQQNPLVRLLAFTGTYRKLTILGCVLAALNSMLAIAPLVCVWFVVRDLVSVAPDWGRASGAETWGWLALAFAVAGVAVYFAALMCTHLAAFRTAANMRKKALEHLAHVPLGYYDENATGHLRRVIDGCAAQTEGILAHKLPDFVASLVTPLAFLIVMFSFDWVMGLACLVPIAVSFFCMYLLMGGGRGEDSDAMRFMISYQDALNKMNKTAVEYVRGIPVVKIFQQTVLSFKAFHEAIIQYRDMAHGYAQSCQKPQVVQLVAINSTFAILIPVGILLAYNTPDFSSFLVDFLFYVIFSAITTSMMSKVMYASEAVTMAADSVRRIEDIIASPVMQWLEEGKGEVPIDDSIEFVNVTFIYPGSERPALVHMSMKVSSQSTVALVGPSGGGKTTAASLVPRFWDVDEGSVSIGGADVRTIPASQLMDRVAFVFQNDRLFKDSLLENIRAARPTANRVEVEAAAKAAQCADIIDKFPEGLDTVVGSDGVYLSGGECQRIALARAILKDSPIIVLDEATAFADPENEVLIQKALAQLTAGKTVLMIAHRLSTVVNADRIYVIDGGRVVEEGSHDELTAKGGLYSTMWKDYKEAATWRIERKIDYAS